MGEGNNWTALRLVAPHAFQPGFLLAFCPSRGKMRLYGLLGVGGGGGVGQYLSVCEACGK